MLNGLGAQTGVSLPKLSAASAFIGARLDHPLPSRYAQAAATARGSGQGPEADGPSKLGPYCW